MISPTPNPTAQLDSLKILIRRFFKSVISQNQRRQRSIFDNKTLILFFVFHFSFFIFYSATAQRKYIVGRVIDPSTLKGVDRASVMNLATRHIVKTNSAGLFSILTGVGDSLIVTSLTHGRNGIEWDGQTEEAIIYSRRLMKAIDLPEVRIKTKRDEQLEREIREILAEPERTTKLGNDRTMELIQSPISLLYEAFSRRAKSDRKVLVLMQQDRRRKLADYRLSMIAGRVTEYRGEALDRFTYFCNFKQEFLLTSSEYELTFEILAAQKEYVARRK